MPAPPNQFCLVLVMEKKDRSKTRRKFSISGSRSSCMQEKQEQATTPSTGPRISKLLVQYPARSDCTIAEGHFSAKRRYLLIPELCGLVYDGRCWTACTMGSSQPAMAHRKTQPAAGGTLNMLLFPQVSLCSSRVVSSTPSRYMYNPMLSIASPPRQYSYKAFASRVTCR